MYIASDLFVVRRGSFLNPLSLTSYLYLTYTLIYSKTLLPHSPELTLSRFPRKLLGRVPTGAVHKTARLRDGLGRD
jgi:hypothetical protein